MERVLICLLAGYLLGSISPSAIAGKIKRTDLRQNGSKNLGATNTLLVLGKAWAAVVLLFDIAKAYAAVYIAQVLLPDNLTMILGAGLAAIIGHCYPFYLGFRGGKGLACFGGVVLAYDPMLFLILLLTAILLVLLVNYSYAMPFYGATAFAIHVAIHTEKVGALTIALVMSLLIFSKHFGNFKKARRGEDIKVREYIRTKLFHR